jgi:hypothetical protein
MLMAEAEAGKVMVTKAEGGTLMAGKVMVAKADRLYADGVGRGREVDVGWGCKVMEEAGKVMVAEADWPYADGGGRGGEVDGGRWAACWWRRLRRGSWWWPIRRLLMAEAGKVMVAKDDRGILMARSTSMVANNVKIHFKVTLNIILML